MFRFSDLEKKLKQKFFFSENFDFVPRHNKVILNCGELHKEGMLLSQKKFSKNLIGFEIFAMF